MRRRRAVLVLVSAFAAWSCEESGPKPQGQQADHVALGGDAVARVGGELISRRLVAEVARAQHVSPKEAVRRLVDDAVAASSAKERGLDAMAPARWRLVAARARTTSERMLAEARAAGPPTDAEVNELSEAHWVQVDRPPTIKVVHALVKKPKDGVIDERARKTAEELRARLVDAKDETDFSERAKAFGDERKGAGVDVVVEALPPFDAQGRELEGGRLVESFAKAAFGISEVGGTSGLVETDFGVHVIRLLERLPEERMPFETRRVAFAEEAVMRRARKAYEARLAALKGEMRVEVLPSAEAAMLELHGAERRP